MRSYRLEPLQLYSNYISMPEWALKHQLVLQDLLDTCHVPQIQAESKRLLGC